ncbi:energy transducer TonB family protein [Nitrospirillum viridazoti]|uniref:Protein TonB n=1 Tax=Nitrospirillum amazonense TaxID=28077 RepID=A0A560HJC1_9PROT|nr:energy transducer TonB [Nitrospirillum amazonense]TWB46586.1 protein TonB [Nitrospirillum amazonense]
MTVLGATQKINAETPAAQTSIRSVEALWRDEDLRARPRWFVSLAAILGIHAAPAFVAAWWFTPVESMPPPPPPAIMVDMAPMPVPPEAAPAEIPPRPQEHRVETAASRPSIKIPPLPHVAKAAAALAAPPRPQPQSTTDETPATETIPQLPAAASPSPAASVPRVAAGPSVSVPTWQGLLLAQLERFKRYPADAQTRHQQGVAYLRFTMDRDGRVLSSRLEKSSGYELLDREVQALIERAQPLPKPPPELGSDRVELVVPIAFSLHGQR